MIFSSVILVSGLHYTALASEHFISKKNCLSHNFFSITLWLHCVRASGNNFFLRVRIINALVLFRHAVMEKWDVNCEYWTLLGQFQYLLRFQESLHICQCHVFCDPHHEYWLKKDANAAFEIFQNCRNTVKLFDRFPTFPQYLLHLQTDRLYKLHFRATSQSFQTVEIAWNNCIILWWIHSRDWWIYKPAIVVIKNESILPRFFEFNNSTWHFECWQFHKWRRIVSKNAWNLVKIFVVLMIRINWGSRNNFWRAQRILGVEQNQPITAPVIGDVT